MKLITQFPLLDSILKDYQQVIGRDFIAYRNHLYRMVNFVNALADLSREEMNRVEIAAAFHDIGIWTKNTVDYIDPSVAEATNWLVKHPVPDPEHAILAMIEWHHKVTAIENHGSRLPEFFRRGDLVDFSLGWVRCGLPRAYIRRVRQQFPNAGFHRMLLRLSMKQLLRHPLNPAPMLRW